MYLSKTNEKSEKMPIKWYWIDFVERLETKQRFVEKRNRNEGEIKKEKKKNRKRKGSSTIDYFIFDTKRSLNYYIRLIKDCTVVSALLTKYSLTDQRLFTFQWGSASSSTISMLRQRSKLDKREYKYVRRHSSRNAFSSCIDFWGSPYIYMAFASLLILAERRCAICRFPEKYHSSLPSCSIVTPTSR